MLRILNDILANVNIQKIIGDTTLVIQQLRLDSRKVESGDVFFAIKGNAVDGHTFISKVIEQGAIAIICEEIPSTIKENIVYVQVQDARKASAIMACNFYQHP